MFRQGMFVALFFTFITALFFLPVFTKHTVPAPLNLLVSYYAPWKNEGFKAANKPIGFDNVRQMLPYKSFSKDAVLKGSLPLWNPNVFAGSPHIASLQPAFFYPWTLFDVLFPLEISWTIVVIAQPIIAGLLTFIFLRALTLSIRASIMGAVSFAFSGWMIAWWEEFLIVTHSIIWLPLALHGSLLLWQRKKYGFFYLTVALTLSVLAGFTQSTIYLFLTVFLWNMWLWYQQKAMAPLIPVLGSGLLTVFLTAIQWVPTAELYLLSRRLSEDASYLFSAHLLPLTHLVTLIAPDYWGNPGTYNAFGNPGFYHERVIYVGLVPLFLALVALFHVKDKHLTFWKYFSLITFSLVFALPTSWIWHTLHIPLLSAMQPTRIMMVVTFGFSVLAAYGFESISKNFRLRNVLVPLGIMVLLLMGAWGWLGWAITQVRLCPQGVLPGLLCPAHTAQSIRELAQYSTVTFRNLIIPSAGLFSLIAILTLLSRWKNLLFFALLSLHLLMMGYFAQKYLYFSQTEYMYPETPIIQAIRDRIGYQRVWGYGNAAIESNIFSYWHIATGEGYAPFFPRQYGELLGAIGSNGTISGAIARSDVTLKNANEVEKMTDNPYRLRLMAILGVRYIMETKNGEGKTLHTELERFPPNLFSLAWENVDWRLWEYKNALPRAFLTSDYIVATQSADYQTLFDPKLTLSRTLILEEAPPFAPTQSDKETRASIVSYEPNTVVLNTIGTHPSLLFLSDSYYPGWNAYVDDKKAHIYRADYAFRAVSVPEGNHAVEFRYEPVSWKYGVSGSIMGIIVCGLLFVIKKRG